MTWNCCPIFCRLSSNCKAVVSQPCTFFFISAISSSVTESESKSLCICPRRLGLENKVAVTVLITGLNSDGGWADLDLFNFSITMDNNCFPIFVGTRSWSGNVYHGNSLVLQYLAFDPTYSVGNQVLNWMYGLPEVAKLPPVSTIPHTRDDFIRVIGWIERIGRSI